VVGDGVITSLGHDRTLHARHASGNLGMSAFDGGLNGSMQQHACHMIFSVAQLRLA